MWQCFWSGMMELWNQVCIGDVFKMWTLASAVYVIVGGEVKNSIQGWGEWQLNFLIVVPEGSQIHVYHVVFSPSMDNLRRGEACGCRCRSYSVRRGRSDVRERFEASLFVHTTVGVLSQKIPMWQCFWSGMMGSNTSHPRISPFSSISELFISPFLFLLWYQTIADLCW